MYPLKIKSVLKYQVLLAGTAISFELTETETYIMDSDDESEECFMAVTQIFPYLNIEVPSKHNMKKMQLF